MNEIWKDIKGYEGIYQASNFGNIRTAPKKTTYSKRHGERHWKVRVLKGRGDNYVTGKRVNLWKNGKPKDFLIARLVAFTFYDEDINNHLLTVNHIDGNRFNNNISNLELVSLGDNIRHAFRTGLIKKSCKPIILSNNNSKERFYSMCEADRFLGRHVGYIYNCIHRNCKIRSSKGELYNYRFI